MSPQELKKLVTICVDLGNRASDETGFVALHRLAKLFRAEVEFRPLLVEGVIAAPNGKGSWKVLIDSEIYPDGATKFPDESQRAPLSVRLRNTIAHELLHTLSFRPEDFGLQLETGKRESQTEALKKLEYATESLSPALLLPQNAIEKALKAQGLSIDTLSGWRNSWVISRENIIARLELIKQLSNSAIRFDPTVTNVALCIGEWVNKDSAVLHEWPIYYSFSNGLVPDFILRLRNKNKPMLRDYFPDKSFYLNGGDELNARGVVFTDITPTSRTEKLSISLTVEKVPRQKGEEFFVLARSTAFDESRSPSVNV